MTGQQFTKYLYEPGLIDHQSLRLIEEIVTRYPYCQTGQLLLACNYYAKDSNHYPGQLKKAAAYAGDRRILKELIGRAKQTGSFIPQPSTLNPPPEPEIAPVEKVLVPYERMTQEELLAIVKKRLEEIETENKQEVHHSMDYIRLPETPATKSSLIEKFIREEPRISKPKATFFNPADSAIRSNFDEEEIVSEKIGRAHV